MKQTTTRGTLYSIARNSNWSATGIDRRLKSSGIYASASEWGHFARLLLVGTGACFIAAGIVFFFAFNWEAIPKFVKFGMIQAGLVAATVFYLFSKLDLLLRNIMLTVNAVLVGVLFAVFGQVYQTGANAYDLFLTWTCAITLWVLVSRFRPLWLLFLVLLNTTLILYANQVATQWSGTLLTNLLFILNAVAVLAHEVLASRSGAGIRSRWFPRVVGLAAVAAITGSIVMGMFMNFKLEWWLSVLLAVVAFSTGIWNGYKTRELFYLSAIPFSLIVIVASFMVRTVEFFQAEELIILCTSLFVIFSTTWLIRNLLQLKNKWHEHETTT